MTDAIRIFISGSCAGLAEVRQALSSHDAIKVVGTAVDAPSAGDRLREETVDVLLHGSSRGDRLPTQDIHTLQSASAAPIVIVTSGCTPEFLQEALAHGVQDVVILPQLTESLVFTLRRAHVLNHNAARPQSQAPSTTRSGGDGRVITVFSPKGGVGKSTISTGLAGAYAGPLKRSTLLIDLDLQFGDVGIMMGIDPTQTIVDLVTTTGELDPDKLGGYVVHHSSGVDILAAPLRPEDAELVTEDRIGQLVDVAKAAYDIVVLDTPPHFDATTLAALDRSDRLVLVTTMDIPTVKNTKLALQTLNLLQYPRERIALVLNRPLPRADLRESDISRTLDMPIAYVIPGDKEVGIAVNRGVPVTTSQLALARGEGNQGARGAPAAAGHERRAGRLRGQGGEGPGRQGRLGPAHEPVQGRQVQVLQAEGQEGGVNMSLQGRIQQRNPEPAAPVTREQHAEPERAPAPTDPFADLKSRVHHDVITRLGPRLFAAGGDEGRDASIEPRVLEAVEEAIALDKTPLTRQERAQVTREIADDILGYGPLEPFLRDDTVSGDHGQRPPLDLGGAPRQAAAHRRGLRRRPAPPADHRQDHLAHRPAHRRGLADGRRPPARRLARERHHPAAGGDRPDAHDP